jgi:hypothetical protein
MQIAFKAACFSGMILETSASQRLESAVPGG